MDRESRNLVVVVLAGILAALSSRDPALSGVVLAVTGLAVVSFFIVRRWRGYE